MAKSACLGLGCNAPCTTYCRCFRISLNVHRLRKSEVTMKRGWWIWTPTVILLALLGTEAEASMFGDTSGDAMQLYDSRMMSSPMTLFPGMYGRSVRPYVVYPSTPALIIVKILHEIPELAQPPTSPPAAPTPPRFWTARCGVFLELDVSPKMNLLEEERKPCSP